jgi:hypothetical protein
VTAPLPHTTYAQQIEFALEALKQKPDMRNKELNNFIRDRLISKGYAAPQFVSNSVFTRARNQLGIVSTRGRPAGSKNHKTKAAAAVPSTGIFTGNEVISVGRFSPARAQSLDELLVPVGRMMRERGISCIELSGEGLRVTRQVSEELVF